MSHHARLELELIPLLSPCLHLGSLASRSISNLSVSSMPITHTHQHPINTHEPSYSYITHIHRRQDEGTCSTALCLMQDLPDQLCGSGRIKQLQAWLVCGSRPFESMITDCCHSEPIRSYSLVSSIERCGRYDCQVWPEQASRRGVGVRSRARGVWRGVEGPSKPVSIHPTSELAPATRDNLPRETLSVRLASTRLHNREQELHSAHSAHAQKTQPSGRRQTVMTTIIPVQPSPLIL